MYEFEKMFLHQVYRKGRKKPCRWSDHFPSDSAPFHLLRVYELLAPKNRGYVYARAKAVQELTAKYRKDGVSKSLIYKLNKLFQKLGILGEERDIAPDGRPVKGWMLNPHDALCTAHPGACNYLGIEHGKGVWFHRRGASTWAESVNDDFGESMALVDER